MVAASLAGAPTPLTLTIHADDDEATELSSMLEEVGRAVADAGGDGATLARASGEGLAATPALTLSGKGRGDIHYSALPEGPEAPPFVEALTGQAAGP